MRKGPQTGDIPESGPAILGMMSPKSLDLLRDEIRNGYANFQPEHETFRKKRRQLHQKAAVTTADVSEFYLSSRRVVAEEFRPIHAVNFGIKRGE